MNSNESFDRTASHMAGEYVSYNEPVAKQTEYGIYLLGSTLKVGTLLYTHPLKEQDALRYQWLRTEFEAGRETYLAEGMPSGESLDKYIDEQLRKAQEK